jgi:pyruvate-ferredoxin/flavodoxin oxidoreductase
VEAESYNGPSLIMCYASCINHGIKRGMGKSQEEMQLAVQCGYWPLYRFNPLLRAEGKNPFSLDSKAPDGSLQQFLAGEVRYASLQKAFPEEALQLNTRLEREFQERYAALQRLAEQPAAPEPAPAADRGQGAAPAAGEPLDACTLSGTAEHAHGALGEPCDDGRAGKGRD